MLVVDGENVARTKYVTLGQLVGNLRVIKDGVGPDDRVIVNGLMRARARRQGDAAGAGYAAPARRRRRTRERRDMKISHFFIDRPIFASVLSIVFIILGGVSFIRLPIAQYPEIAPPIINVSGQYPGANAEVVATTVVAPIEEQINGVENMLYMSSNATADGRFSIAVTFDIGTNLDIAQVQVQNRVGIAQPRLPVDVRQIGVTVTKSSPDLMMVVHLHSPDRSRDALYVSNYATLEIKDALTRVDGVGSITVFGSRDYSMRIWLDPGRLQALNMTANDVTLALQAQNIQVASGVLNQPPVEKPGAFQIAVQTQGRLANPEEFANIVVKQTAGAVVRLRDVAEVQLAAQDYSSNSYLGRNPAVALAIFQRPGSNALATADAIVKTMEGLSKRFPPGIEHAIVYNPTEFIRQSVNAVIETILEAVVLVVLVIIIFLQTWRAAIIPIVAIPVSLIGTFFFMSMFGFTLNNLTLFGLVLAVGIVVDDAIVVVENVERNIAAGLDPREAAIRSMDEVGTALIAIALVLCAVFIPSAFITGISGQFYRQFALTIAGATIVSCTVSLTLSPALCAMLLKPHDPQHRDRWWEVPVHGFFRLFNFGFDKFANGYGWIVRKVVRFAAIMLLIYAGVLAYGLNEFRKTPTGFIPQLDRGIIIVAAQLPPGAALSRTDDVMRRAMEIGLEVPGVDGRHGGGRLFRCDLHQCAELGRDLPRARSVGGACEEAGPVVERDPGRAVAALRGDPGVADHRDPAAAGAGHRQRRRLPHDGGGPRRARAAGAAGSRRRDDGAAPRRRPVCNRYSRCSRPPRRSSISISTA